MADDDELWKRRFFAFYGVRALGVVTFLAGVAIIYTDILRDGGWPVVGAIVAIMGAIDAGIAPLLIKRGWDRDKRK